ncbi:MAG: alpha/beta hydrolase, partial [Chloroflexota bacterium]
LLLCATPPAQAFHSFPSAGAGLHTITIQSKALGRATPVNLLLPQGYAATNRRYPVLYLLHGFSNSYASWATNTDLIRFARSYPLIIVMPTGDNGWYINDANGGPRWADYDLDELIPYVDHHFRTIAARAGRAIAGLSMGGFGALSLAAHRPDLFIAAASFSGALDVERLPALGFGIAEAFGLKNTWLRTANSPLELAANLTSLQLIYMATGTGQPGPLDRQGSRETSAVEEVLYPGFLRTVAAIRAAGGKPVTHVFSPGTHSWPYWQADLHAALPLIMTVFAHPKPAPRTWSYKTGAASATIWNYKITIGRRAGSNGFVTLSKVSTAGFQVSGTGHITVKTAPRYRAGHRYALRWDGRPIPTVRADHTGSLLLRLPPTAAARTDTLSIGTT